MLLLPEVRARELLQRVNLLLLSKSSVAGALATGKYSYLNYFRDVWGTDPPTAAELGMKTYDELRWCETALALYMLMIVAYRSLRIANVRPLRSLAVVVEGRKGTGKTTYVVRSLATALVYLGFTPEEAVRYVKERIFWRMVDFARFVHGLVTRGEWTPFVVLDDVGLHASKYWFMKPARGGFIALAEALDTAKDWCGLVVMTTPRYTKMARFLREFGDFVVTASTSQLDGRLFNEFRWKGLVAPLAGKRAKSELQYLYVDVTPPDALMPDEIWVEMMAVRRVTTAERMEDFEKVAEEVVKGGGEEGG